MKFEMLANTKRVLMAAAFFGTVSLASAQTDKKETAAKAETAVTTQVAVQTTPEIEGLKKQVAANPKDAEALSKLAVAYQMHPIGIILYKLGHKSQHCCQIGLQLITARELPTKI